MRVDLYSDTPGEMEVYPDLSIIGRGKDMQPYSYQRATEMHMGNKATPNQKAWWGSDLKTCAKLTILLFAFPHSEIDAECVSALGNDVQLIQI